ncbi:MAG: tetratricopeptide repeat protein, partial [Prevotella sp.]
TLVERFPRDGHVVADLIGVLLSQDYNRPEMAVMYGEQYCKTDSFNTEVNRALGEAYFIERKFTQCVDTYRRVFAAGDTTYNALYYTGGSFEYMEQLDSAACYFAKAVEMNPKMAVGNYRLGIVENRLGRYDDALVHLKAAAVLYEPSKPLMFVIYKTMGEAKYSLKNFKEAYLYWGYALAYDEDKELTERRAALKKQLRP